MLAKVAHVGRTDIYASTGLVESLNGICCTHNFNECTHLFHTGPVVNGPVYAIQHTL